MARAPPSSAGDVVKRTPRSPNHARKRALIAKAGRARSGAALPLVSAQLSCAEQPATGRNPSSDTHTLASANAFERAITRGGLQAKPSCEKACPPCVCTLPSGSASTRPQKARHAPLGARARCLLACCSHVLGQLTVKVVLTGGSPVRHHREVVEQRLPRARPRRGRQAMWRRAVRGLSAQRAFHVCARWIRWHRGMVSMSR